MADTGYSSTASAVNVGGGPAAPDSPGEYLSHAKLKKQYLAYLSDKRAEIDEQKESRRYRHGSQYTSVQYEALRRRKQPPVIYNRISRKIDGVVGFVEKLRQDPKAYPRTPQHEQGAELATAVIRYVMDEQEWKAKSPICAGDGGTEGIGGVEIIIEEGDRGDKEVGFDVVDTDGFFYDPRSYRLDFSDARYMGVGKWVDIEQAKEMFPDKADELNSLQDGSDLTSSTDRDQKWYSPDNGRVRIVDHWYMHKGMWCFCIYTGSMKLMEGVSYLFDEKNKTICKYVMYSANVDQDGDRYGFVRIMKSAQDEINARGSKGLHELNTRRIVAENGAFDDIEVARREAARPDGIVIRNKNFEAEFDDSAKTANLEGQLKFRELAVTEIENFGPNPAVLGQGLENSSGRAIALLQQAGASELGPFILSYRGWKLRVYRALFNAVQRHWAGERWVRVTDDQQVAQFIQINGVGIDPRTGQPAMVNAIGSLDVDIILDEGADSINMQADSYELLQALAGKGAEIPPQVLIELAPLESSVKKRVLDMIGQAQQAAQQQKDKEMQLEAMKIQPKQQEQQQDPHAELAADTALKMDKQRSDEQLGQAKLASDSQLAARKAAQEIDLARQKAAAEIQLKREIAAADIEIEAHKTHSKVRLESDQANHRMSLDGERHKSEAETKAAPMKELVKALTAPKKVIRDAQGRVAGVETVSA